MKRMLPVLYLAMTALSLQGMEPESSKKRAAELEISEQAPKHQKITGHNAAHVLKWLKKPENKFPRFSTHDFNLGVSEQGLNHTQEPVKPLKLVRYTFPSESILPKYSPSGMRYEYHPITLTDLHLNQNSCLKENNETIKIPSGEGSKFLSKLDRLYRSLDQIYDALNKDDLDKFKSLCEKKSKFNPLGILDENVLNVRDDKGHPIFFRAILNRAYNIMQYLIQMNPTVLSQKVGATTPLRAAAMFDDRACKILAYQVKNSPLINSVDQCHNTPLFYCASVNRANDLINAGANILHKNSDQQNVVHYIIIRKLPFETKQSLVNYYLDLKPDFINEQDCSGFTPLDYVRSEELARILVKKGANVNLGSTDGHTPLHVCMSYSKCESIDPALYHYYVEECGLSLLSPDKQNLTPAMIAQKYGNRVGMNFATQWAIERWKAGAEKNCMVCQEGIDEIMKNKGGPVITDYGCLAVICSQCKETIRSGNSLCPHCRRDLA